ncbi:MAG: YggS family pyridoxal phosphate-dependent enzyme [Ignavibacteria bacterium]|jgi:pyridoxal phosphate enzyme (YggS family)
MIAEKYKLLQEKVKIYCENCGRKAEEVKIIAVSKTQPIEIIKEAVESGIKVLGENKAQELKEKVPLIGEDVEWHFIGHLQKNKVKFVVGNADFIHSIDSLKLAEVVNKKAEELNIVQKIFLEIKTSAEESKYGLSDFEEILQIAEYCRDSQNLDLQGLMTMAPFVDDETIIRKSFKELKSILLKINTVGFNLKELSMGMTNDYEIAIEEGATMIRIGTALFGERNYSSSWKAK